MNSIQSDFDKGQHFLVDEKIIEEEIKAAELRKDDKVIEIGAGSGMLTRQLAKKSHVLAFEIDEKFREDLEGIDNAKIVIDNALKNDWRGYSKIVSNIPYFLSEPIILKAIRDNINLLVLIVGEKFKTKLEGDEKIGRVARLFFNVKIISEVSSLAFEPQPRVNSYLIKLQRKKQSKLEKLLGSIVMREGKIKNSIIYALVASGKTKNQAREIIGKLGLNKSALEKPVSKITDALLARLNKSLNQLFLA